MLSIFAASARRVFSLVAALVALTLAAGCARETQPAGDYAGNSKAADVLQMARVVTHVSAAMDKLHLEPPPSDQSLGVRTVDALTRALDPDRLYLLDSDVKDATATASSWPSLFRDGNVEPARELVRRFQARVKVRADFAVAALSSNSLAPPSSSLPSISAWAATPEELDARWTVRLATQVADSVELGIDSKTAVDLWLSVYRSLPQQALEAHPVEMCSECIDAFVNAYDSGSSYLPDIDIDYSQLKLEGIGLVLRKVGDRTEIVSLVSGGPAERGNKLRQGDVVIAIGDSPTNLQHILGWSLDKSVKLMRGQSGSELFLKIVRQHDKGFPEPQVIAVRRERVLLQEQTVRGTVIDIVRDGAVRRVGVVHVPAFYVDFKAQKRGDINVRSVVRDVGLALTDLQRQDTEAIVLDMRGNGGGALQQAVDLTASFMKPAPVAIIQGRVISHELLTPAAQTSVYNGPVTVLLDRDSGAGTELFAAALRDHGRAVLLGERTAGAGTIRSVVDLPGRQEMGSLLITIARFYRTDGRGIQLSGLEPDLLLPANMPSERQYDPLELPAKSIDVPKTSIDELQKTLLPSLKQLHKARLAELTPSDSEFDDFWVQQAAEVALDILAIGKQGNR